MIQHTSFAHGWFYHYRHHVPKTHLLCKDNYSSLGQYIERMHTQCPHDYFQNGPRSSKLRLQLPACLHHVQGHEVSTLAKLGHEAIERGTAHTKVQLFMLERDEKTIAVEVPLWLSKDELKGYEQIFQSTLPLTGHIDVLRIEEDRIWVWDYKPNAQKEKYAATQVYFYALMLSLRTGIPLESIYCGYFDEKDSYMFRPEKLYYEKMLEGGLVPCPLIKS